MLYMLSVTFDDADIMEYNGPEVSLDRPTAKMAHVPDLSDGYLNCMAPWSIYSRSVLSSDLLDDYSSKGYNIFACTFTYPDMTKCKGFKTTKNGKLKLDYLPLEVGTQYEQRNKMTRDLDLWLTAVNKLSPRTALIEMGDVYFELTKRGRIHGHGVILTQNNYTRGLSEIMSIQWARISKGSMTSMHKTNATGGRDHAFDRCNNVASWLNYISKEYKPEMR